MSLALTQFLQLRAASRAVTSQRCLLEHRIAVPVFGARTYATKSERPATFLWPPNGRPQKRGPNQLPYHPKSPFADVLWHKAIGVTLADEADSATETFVKQRMEYDDKMTRLRKLFAAQLAAKEAAAAEYEGIYRAKIAKRVAAGKARKAIEKAEAKEWTDKLMEADRAKMALLKLEKAENYAVHQARLAAEKRACLSKQKNLSAHFLPLDQADRQEQIDDLLADEVSYNTDLADFQSSR